MASGSGPQRNSQLRIDSPRPRQLASPYPLRPPTLSRNSPPTIHGSTSTQWNSSTNIPLRAELTSLEDILKSVKSRFSKLPPIRSALDKLEGYVACMQVKQISEQHWNKYEELISYLTDLIPVLWRPFMESNPKNIPQEVCDIAKSINKKLEDFGAIQSYSQPETDEKKEKLALKCFQGLSEHFRRLQAEISAWEKQREQWTDACRKDLLPTHESYYNAALPTAVTKRVECTENTRVDLLNDLWVWSRAHDTAKIYWLNGMAGTGKTTIAYTMCKRLQEDGRLAASFFCSRNSLECRDVNKMVPTIAYQLGHPGLYSNSYRYRLCTAFEEDTDVARRDISTQFENLIAKPLSTMGQAIPSNMVVIIDALDECTDLHGAEVVLNMLLRHVENLPIKFFVTSRPEPAIIQRMTAGDGAMRSILWLHDIDRSLVQADIRTYLADALRSIQVSSSELDAIAEKAGCLFIFAATAVRYIVPSRGSVNHRQRLQTVLNLPPRQGNKSHKDIDDLYTTILSNALDGEVFEEEELVIRKRVLWAVACASGPLTMSAIAELLNLTNVEVVEVAIQPLQSVLRISEITSMVSTLHASFPDFLLSEERAGPFFCNEILQSAYLAERCFHIMDQSLQFNICRLESSYMLDRDVPDLQDRVDRVISNELFYACRYWGDHLAKSPYSTSLMDLLGSFMRHQLLSWIEVLNLKKHVGHGDGVLGQALTWLMPEGGSTDLQDLVHDARSFMVIFASSPSSLSTPHIYISALPFTSKQSRVWTMYWPRTRGLIRVEGAPVEASGNSVLATWNVGAPVHGIAQSSDGKRIATCSSLGCWQWFHVRMPQNVDIWDASSGTHTLGPLKGHKKPTLSVAFSPNDAHIASGSADHTICIWDAGDGRLVSSPLRGHAAPINSVSFSPDGTRLASGSDDHTVRVWDAYTGAHLGEPLIGHRDSVNSVAFSPDGKHLASGSSDHSIRLWQFRPRVSLERPLEGHTQSVNSVSYSPNALHLVSGSKDRTVRVWDVSSGKPLVGPFVGHTGAVSSVSFSPNGSQVVSGSHDGTIIVWGAASGVLLAGPFDAHSRGINSVLFTAHGTRILSGSDNNTIHMWDARRRVIGATKSLGHTGSGHPVALSPDGKRAAFGSSDSTICVWDTHNGALLTGPFTGHVGWIYSVAFSPDGARVVSGSADHTLRTWDTSTGSLLAGPFEGHSNLVATVSFSPDGNRVASGSYDYTIRIWNSYTGESIAKPFKGHTGPVASIAFSPNGARLVSGSHDFTVRMWDTNDNTLSLWTSDAHADDVHCVGFSPDGTQIVSGSWDKTILVLGAADGAVLHGPFTGHIDYVLSVAFSPDGTRVVSGSRDQTVRVWDIESCTVVVGPLMAHGREVKFVAFSPDGTRLISGSADDTIRFWDLAATTHSGTTSHYDLALNEDGWLANQNSQLFLWVPPDLRKSFNFPSYSNPSIFSRLCSSFIDNSTLHLGDQWQNCYGTNIPPTV